MNSPFTLYAVLFQQDVVALPTFMNKYYQFTLRDELLRLHFDVEDDLTLLTNVGLFYVKNFHIKLLFLTSSKHSFK